jgi:hypothetical protein
MTADAGDPRPRIAVALAELVQVTKARWSARKLKALAENEPYSVMRALAVDATRLCVSNPAEIAEMLAGADAMISTGNSIAIEMVGVGFLENVQNITSHDDVECTPQRFYALLARNSRSLWDYQDELWLRVAAQTDSRAPLSPEQIALVGERGDGVAERVDASSTTRSTKCRPRAKRWRPTPASPSCSTATPVLRTPPDDDERTNDERVTGIGPVFSAWKGGSGGHRRMSANNMRRSVLVHDRR